MEKRLFPRKIIENAYIKANKNRCMNINEGLGVTTIYGKGKEGMGKRKFTYKGQQAVLFTSDLKDEPARGS